MPKKTTAAKKAPAVSRAKTRATKPKAAPRKPDISAVHDKKRRKPSFSIGTLVTHVSIAGISIAILLLLATLDPATFSTLPGKAERTPVAVQVGLEYDAPVKVEMLFARKQTAGYLSISNPSDHPIKISVPDSWSRTEVRGAPLTEFATEPPQFGFRRWSMPARTGMSMLLPESPSTVLFLSPSDPTAAITLRSVDAVSGEQFINVVLLNKEVETALWQD